MKDEISCNRIAFNKTTNTRKIVQTITTIILSSNCKEMKRYLIGIIISSIKKSLIIKLITVFRSITSSFLENKNKTMAPHVIPIVFAIADPSAPYFGINMRSKEIEKIIAVPIYNAGSHNIPSATAISVMNVPKHNGINIQLKRMTIGAASRYLSDPNSK